jgi:hypothetical protein
MSTTRQSTQEEAEARRDEVAAAECKGDGIHSTDMRFWHDWRLWKREPRYTPDGASFGSWPLGGFTEQWYCTRCRKFEERVVPLEGEVG